MSKENKDECQPGSETGSVGQFKCQMVYVPDYPPRSPP